MFWKCFISLIVGGKNKMVIFVNRKFFMVLICLSLMILYFNVRNSNINLIILFGIGKLNIVDRILLVNEKVKIIINWMYNFMKNFFYYSLLFWK